MIVFFNLSMLAFIKNVKKVSKIDKKRKLVNNIVRRKK